MTRGTIGWWASRARCVAVGSAATAAAVATSHVLVALLAGPVATPSDAVVHLCAIALVVCLLWGWTATLAVVVEAWVGAERVRTPGVPAAVRRVVLAACGVALASSVVGGAQAAPRPHRPGDASAEAVRPDQVLAGLPMPDRADGGRRGHRTAGPVSTPATGRTRTVVVRPGDSLWSIAAADLPTTADPVAVQRHWERLIAVNRSVVGPDPDLIHPGLVLRLPRRAPGWDARPTTGRSRP